MSESAPRRRRAVAGWSKLPHAVVENQSLLTPSELALALIAVRCGSSRTVTDERWQQWTGKTARMKEHAEKGLQDKGIRDENGELVRPILTVTGRGKSAKYAFDKFAWNNYVSRCSGASVKPRTQGRRAVDPTPGAKIHPECRANGCGVLRLTCGETGLSPELVTPIAKPVSRFPDENTPTDAGGKGEGDKNVTPPKTAQAGIPAQGGHGPALLQLVASASNGQTKVSSSLASSVAKPVSRFPGGLSVIWAAALAMLSTIFPMAGVDFLARLLSVVCSIFPDVTDEQLAAAIRVAWNSERATQKGPGLFLVTVPRALQVLRENGGAGGIASPDRVARPDASPPFDVGEVHAYVARCVEATRSAGYHAAADQLAAIDVDGLFSNLERLEIELQDVEIDLLVDLRASAAHRIDRAAFERELKPYRGKVSTDQFATLERQFLDRALLQWANLPRLSLFYL